MIDIGVVFWVAIFLVAVSATIRGWTNELVVLSGLMLSPLIVTTFGGMAGRLAGILSSPEKLLEDPNQIVRYEFYILLFIHLVVVYFSYKGPLLAERVSRKGLRPRDRVLDRIAAFVVGIASGYMSVGMIWSLLEYRMEGGLVTRLAAQVQYPFDLLYITRPLDSVAIYQTPAGIERLAHLDLLMTNLPLPVIEPVALIAVIVAFVFIVVVMI
jgi:hypothetical protein